MIEDVDYTASGYIEAVAPDGTVISRHRQEREAQQACFQHAKENGDLLGDGVHDYIIRSPDVRMSIRILNIGGNPTNEDTTPPDAPAGVFNNGITSSGFTTNWTNGSESDLQATRIYRSTVGPSSGFVLVDTVTVPTASYSHTGLAAETQYWVHVTAVDSSGNESVDSSVVSATTTASGDNDARVAALISGYTVPANSQHTSHPADPAGVLTDVTASTLSEFESVVNAGARRITVTSTLSGGSITLTGSDVDIVMANSATISADITFNGIRRLRWTGGGHIGNYNIIDCQDMLFDNWVSTYNGSTTSNNFQTIDSARCYWINSTWNYNNPATGGGWGIHSTVPTVLVDGAFINCYIRTPAGQCFRMNFAEQMWIVDSYIICEQLGTGNVFRMHNRCDGVWVKNSVCVGVAQFQGVGTGARPAAFHNATFDGYTRYGPGTWLGNDTQYDPGEANTGDAINCTVHQSPFFNGSINLIGLTDQGGNTLVEWDGATIPSTASYGADH